jgi:hypothetical protein
MTEQDVKKKARAPTAKQFAALIYCFVGTVGGVHLKTLVPNTPGTNRQVEADSTLRTLVQKMALQFFHFRGDSNFQPEITTGCLLFDKPPLPAVRLSLSSVKEFTLKGKKNFAPSGGYALWSDTGADRTILELVGSGKKLKILG